MAQVNLTSEQRRTLIRILAVYANINLPLQRQFFFDNTGLSDEVPELLLSLPLSEPDTRIFSNELINSLQRRGTLQQTQQPALVLVLRYLREEVIGGHEKESEFLDQLLAPYQSKDDVKSTQVFAQSFTAILSDNSLLQLSETLDPEPTQSVVIPQPKIVAPQKITPQQQKFLDIIQDMRYPIEERAKAGMELAAIGDPRPGVGLREDGVPDILWCEVPGKDKGRPPVKIGGDDKAFKSFPAQTIDLPTFAISKYPITYRQFQAFIEDKGFKNDHPAYNQTYKHWNHPRDSVTWYAAMAYCKWLSVKLEQTVRLPTEEEWEKAARGEDGRFYPWGNAYISGYANINETYKGYKVYEVGKHNLGQTSAVGIYPPESASPYGVMDMAGNAWEWTLSTFEQKEKASEQQADQTLHNDKPRVLRGGAFNFNEQGVRCAARYEFDPLGQNWHDGFRVAVVAVSPFPLKF